MKIPLVSDFIPQKLRAIPKQVRAAMLSAFIVGLACHIQILTQLLLNHDTVTSLGDDGMWLLTQGKWFFGYLAGLRGSIASGGIETMLALLFLSLVAGLTVSILRVKNLVHAVFVGAFLVAFPSVICNMLYMGEDTFFAALVLATLGVYFTTKYKLGYIGGTVLLTLSLGTYQTYIGYAAGLFVIVVILDILENEKKPAKILLDGLKYIAVMLVAVGLYYVCLQILLKVRGVELSSYMNVNSIGNFSVGSILSQAWIAYKESLKFMFFDYFGTKQAIFVWCYRLVVLVDVVLFILIAYKKKLYKNILMLLLVVVLGVFALPLAVNAISVLSQTFTHWLMKYPFVLMFVVMIALLERFLMICRDKSIEKQNKKNIVQNIFPGIHWLAVALAAVLVFNWFLLANQGYQKMRFTTEAITSKTSGLIQAIYNENDYTEGIEIAIVGNAPFKYLKDPKDVFNIYQCYTGFDDTENVLYNSGILLAYMRNYLGVSFNTVDGVEFEAQHQEEVDNMGVYPGKESIELIDGVLVVKLSETKDETVGTE